MTFDELTKIVTDYLLLEDKLVIKLLCATVVANRLPGLDPTWLFLISNTSGGKSELLSAVAQCAGSWEQDDLTSKSFISGATRGGIETSLLHRLPKKNPIMLIKDLTLLLDKDPKESSQIFSQLRLIYDQKLNKSFGTGEDVKVAIKLGLIAGTTQAIEDIGAKQAAMGQRAIRYLMIQPNRKAVTRRIMGTKNKKELRDKMGKAFREYLDNNIKIPSVVPELSEKSINDIIDLADMATLARSAVKRKEYDSKNRIERTDLAEMPGRMAEQLKNLALAMMVINGTELLGMDFKILYKIAIDSIPSLRKDVMVATTKYARVELKALARDLQLPEESVKMAVEDLTALGVIRQEIGLNRKFQYYLVDDIRTVMSNFENIQMTDKVLELEEEIPETNWDLNYK